MKWFFKPLKKLPYFREEHSLFFLNTAQFLGVLNDNIFKLLIVFFLIEQKGAQEAGNILSLVGIIFVAPFILFSSAAGILADRFSKQRLLILMKLAEIGILFLSLFAFGYKSEWGCYCLLFLLASHSAAFGPSKYGIILEIEPEDRVAKANGLITSFTYLGMIFGVFLAAFLTDLMDHRFILVALVCLVFAILGFFSTFGIRQTEAQGADKKINFLFISEIVETLKACRRQKDLLPSIFAAAFFLFVGAFTQLNVIPFAMEELTLSDVAGGYLFLSTALGIAVGAFVAGRVSKKKVELGLSVLSLLGIAVFFFFLFFFSHYLLLSIIFLALLGFFGGMFIVPLEAYIQLKSPSEKRGQVIAATNFVSFCGVLLASLAIYIFSQKLHVSSSTGFALVGAITFFIFLLFLTRFFSLFLHYFGRTYVAPLMRIQPLSDAILEKKRAIFLLKRRSFIDLLILAALFPHLQLFIPCKGWFSAQFLRFLGGASPLLFEKQEEWVFQIKEKLETREVAILIVPAALFKKLSQEENVYSVTIEREGLFSKSPTQIKITRDR